MADARYVKVFAGLALYYDLIPRSLVDEGDLKGSLNTPRSNLDSDTDQPLFSGNLRGINVSTLYLMQHIENGCDANCAYCVQARDSVHEQKKSLLVDKEVVRITLRSLQNFLKNSRRIEEIERICIQTIFNKNSVENLFQIVRAIREVSDISISVCCIPLSMESLVSLKESGVDRVTINYETATPELFSRIRGKARNGPYRWSIVTQAIDNSLNVFGNGQVATHLQIGLGETQQEALEFVQNMTNKKVLVGLFSFCPVPGTALAGANRVTHAYYHQVQLGTHLIKSGTIDITNMSFDELGNIVDYGIPYQTLQDLIWSGFPFKNTGCPGCNRVFYETNPGERFYSYPRDLYDDEKNQIAQELLGRFV